MIVFCESKMGYHSIENRELEKLQYQKIVLFTTTYIMLNDLMKIDIESHILPFLTARIYCQYLYLF